MGCFNNVLDLNIKPLFSGPSQNPDKKRDTWFCAKEFKPFPIFYHNAY